jgi:cytochrome P450
MAGELLNPFDPAAREDPYAVYARMREQVPVWRVPAGGQHGFWVLTRYADVEKALRDPRMGKDPRNALPPEQIPPSHPIAAPLTQHMLAFDPPDHTRLRALVALAFTPRLIEGQRERVERIAEELIDAVEPHGRMDLIDAYAFPLPIRVITHLLGVPESDADRFRAWSNTVVSLQEGSGGRDDLLGALTAFRAYLLDLFAAKRRAPGDDLVSGLLRAEEEGDALSEDELIAMVFLLLIAGHETTVNLIGNGVLALMTNPEQREALQDDPSLLRPAIEELLRYDPPVETSTLRYVLEDMEIGGQQLRRGDSVLVVIASANRDEAQFPAADELDLGRPDNRHVAFGKGIHYCLGAPLARMEGAIAISTLLRRLPTLHLATDPTTLEHRPSFLIRGLKTLPVAW